jgi:hypothetical protein
LSEILLSLFQVGADFAPENELEKFSAAGIFGAYSFVPLTKNCEKSDLLFTLRRVKIEFSRTPRW